jgi:hypothetical protein
MEVVIMAKAEGKGTTAEKRGVVNKMPAVPTKIVPGKPGDEKEKKTVAKANSLFTLLKSKDENAKMPKQCQQILEILAKAKDKTLSRNVLLEEMKKIVETRQPIERILGFYQSRLVSGNYVRITAAPAPAKEAKEAKEAK